MISRDSFSSLTLATIILVSVAGTTAAGSSDTRQKLRELHQAIEAEIGTPRAETAEQCRTVALGAKPCGGPWRYLVYSSAVSDEKRLGKLVSEYNALERKLNVEEGRISDCSFVVEPKVTLVDDICVAAPSR